MVKLQLILGSIECCNCSNVRVTMIFTSEAMLNLSLRETFLHVAKDERVAISWLGQLTIGLIRVRGNDTISGVRVRSEILFEAPSHVMGTRRFLGMISKRKSEYVN